MFDIDSVVVHTLVNGSTIITLSPHGAKMSDGTEMVGQVKEVVDFFTLKRENKALPPIKGMGVSEVKMVLSDEQIDVLSALSKTADIVLVPFPFLSALREAGTISREGIVANVRALFYNVVAYNATVETMRSPPQDKVIDINNWSY